MGRYKGRRFTRERIIVAGDRMEVSVYPVFQHPGQRRSRCRESSEVQKRLNERNSWNQLTRIVYANFSEQDLVLHLTYEQEPKSMEEGIRLLDNYVKKLRRHFKKAEIEMKYIKRTERGKKRGRVHHHLFLTGGLDRDEIEQLWTHGRCNSRRLQFGEDGIDGLASYVAGAGKQRDTYRRWSCSRNCVRPAEEVRDGAMALDEADDLGEAASVGLAGDTLEMLYPGWECIRCEGIKNEMNQGWYTYAMLRRKRDGKNDVGRAGAA